MASPSISGLEQQANRIDRWLAEDKLPLAEVRRRLAKLGCAVSLARLTRWQAEREGPRTQEWLLEQIARGARQCREVERQLRRHPAPEVETLIKLYRVLILRFSLEAEAAPELLKLVNDLMKPVLEWGRLEEKRKERQLAERKYRDQVETRKAAETRAAKGDTLTPETLEKIERELNLL
jgi:hypothetical protein